MNLQDVLNLQPINKTDSGKVRAIADSVLADGWVGAPLVVSGGILIAGSHRIEALALIQSELVGFEVPVVELSDIFEEASLDLDEIMEDEGCDEAWDSGFSFVLDSLPAEFCEQYGIQW